MINPFRIDAYHKTFSTVLALGQVTGSNQYGVKACQALK